MKFHEEFYHSTTFFLRRRGDCERKKIVPRISIMFPVKRPNRARSIKRKTKEPGKPSIDLKTAPNVNCDPRAQEIDFLSHGNSIKASDDEFSLSLSNLGDFLAVKSVPFSGLLRGLSSEE